MQVAQRNVRASNLFFTPDVCLKILQVMSQSILFIVSRRWLWRRNQWVTCTQETLDELVKTKSDAAPGTQDTSLAISSTNFVSFMVATWPPEPGIVSSCRSMQWKQMLSAFVRQLLQATATKSQLSCSQNLHENVPVEKDFLIDHRNQAPLS